MSSNTNDITLSNYEEYFILYMDNELSAERKAAVENFISLHPHLAEELEILMSTKLPVDVISFHHKEVLHAASMQMNSVEEELLLYVDGELSGAEKTSVEKMISSNKDYALQHSLLMQTRLDASETVFYPNKKELYRHSEKVVYFPVWMRVAVAVILLLSGSLFFLINSNKIATNNLVVQTPPVNLPVKKNIVPEQKGIPLPQQKEEPVLVKVTEEKKSGTSILKTTSLQDKDNQQMVNDVATENNLPERKREVIKFDAAHFTTTPNINNVALNKTITHTYVTSPITASLNKADDPTEQDLSDGDFKTEKKTRAKGFLRKVSRFIERNTGIGTANADNELLVGVVALKLK